VVTLLLAGLALPACSATPPARPAASTASAPGRAVPGRAAPRRAPAGSHPSLPTVVRHGRRASGMVALTFDANMTDAMLAELARHQVASFDDRRVVDELVAERVPATFFLAGKWVERYPEETRRIATDPLFEVGSHSHAHRAFHLPCYGLR
jgi:peptidoglycan/xylan/chitin deacetylase (PgdA/CDA1 family)